MDIVEHGSFWHGTFKFEEKKQWRPPDDDRDAKSNASKMNMLMVEKRINFIIYCYLNYSLPVKIIIFVKYLLFSCFLNVKLPAIITLWS